MSHTVTTAVDDAVCTIEFRDPDTKNALSAALLADLRDALDEAESTDGVRVLVLRADPVDGTYCSGYDLTEFDDGKPPAETEGHFEETMRRLGAVDVPVVVAVEGDVWGGGVELAATCDLRVAARGSRFGVPPAKLGIVYHARGVQRFLALLGPANTGELLYTANPIEAERAKEMGFLNRLVDPADLDACTEELAADVAANAPLSLTGTKETIRAFVEANALPDEKAARIEELRREAYESRDHAEAKAAFEEGRTPEFEGR